MKKRILIIDNNEMLLGLISICYSEIFELFLCKNLKETQTYLQNGLLPDGIVTDFNLPNEDDKNFIQKIKNNPLYAHVPLIVLSDEEKTRSRTHCLKSKINDYVIKPFNPDELQLRIEKQLSN
jgi:DNA-binding response OmpR family regulator